MPNGDFVIVFSRKGNWFSQPAGKYIPTELPHKKNFPLDGQARRAKSSSQPVNSVVHFLHHLMKSLAQAGLQSGATNIKPYLSDIREMHTKKLKYLSNPPNRHSWKWLVKTTLYKI